MSHTDSDPAAAAAAATRGDFATTAEAHAAHALTSSSAGTSTTDAQPQQQRTPTLAPFSSSRTFARIDHARFRDQLIKECRKRRKARVLQELREERRRLDEDLDEYWIGYR